MTGSCDMLRFSHAETLEESRPPLLGVVYSRLSGFRSSRHVAYIPHVFWRGSLSNRSSSNTGYLPVMTQSWTFHCGYPSIFCNVEIAWIHRGPSLFRKPQVYLTVEYVWTAKTLQFDDTCFRRIREPWVHSAPHRKCLEMHKRTPRSPGTTGFKLRHYVTNAWDYTKKNRRHVLNIF